tara:strand:- start:60 stop:605 length:546 start_codon:yes stop_codon:yes gene_type:complete
MKIKERENQEEKFKSYLINSLNLTIKDTDLHTEIKLKIEKSNSNTFFSDYHSHFNELFSTNKDFVELVINNKIVEHSYYYNDLTTLISYYFKNCDIDKIVFFAELFYIHKELNHVEFIIANNLTNLHKKKHHRLTYFLLNTSIMRIFCIRKELTLKNIMKKTPKLGSIYKRINVINNIDSF